MYIGYVEASNGVGMLCGPLIGAMLYSIGGFMMPFATFAILYLVSYPYIMLTLVKAKQVLRPTQDKPEAEEKKDVQLSLLMDKPRFVYGLLSQMMIIMST